jgi:hypothetical protein
MQPPSPRNGLRLGKIGKIPSSLLNLPVWTVIAWKPIWTAAGADGERILAAILLALKYILVGLVDIDLLLKESTERRRASW